MPVLRNPKYEKFAQAIASGQDLTSAYVLAGYKKSYQNAHRMSQHEDILTRVSEIQTRRDESLTRAETRAMNAVSIDRKMILRRLLDAADRSQRANDTRNEVKALELLGKECGMFVQRTEIGQPGSFEALDTTQQILDAVRAQLGDDAYNAMAALLDRNRAAKSKVIEHHESEQDPDVIEG